MRLRDRSLEGVLLPGLQVHHNIHRHGSHDHFFCRTGCFGRLFSVSNDPFLSLAEAATSIFFVAIKVLSPQIHVCRRKDVFVATKHVFCLDKKSISSLLSGQNYVCCDKNAFSLTYIPQQVISNSGSSFQVSLLMLF